MNQEDTGMLFLDQKTPNSKTILAIWAFKRKRFTDSRINKRRTRPRARGSMKTYGVSYWKTYAPTVNWINIRFLLIVPQILQLNTQAIYFVLVFPQANLEAPVDLELPARMDLERKGGPSSNYV